jgi:hypothetical protein
VQENIGYKNIIKVAQAAFLLYTIIVYGYN